MSSTAAPDTELSLLIQLTAPSPANSLLAAYDEVRLYDLADAHHLKMLLYRGLVQANHHSPLRARLEAELAEQALRYEFVYPQQLAQVLAALHTAGVRTLLLKGYALGQTIYRQSVLRPYSDFDILIPLESMDAALAALRRLGYFPDSDPDYPPDYHLHHHHIVPYLHPEWLPVELHWRLVSGAENIDLDTVWASAQPLAVNDVTTLTLLPEHLLIYLALHAVSNHLFDIGLRALTDVSEVIQACSLDWQQIVQISRAWGCSRQVYIVLRLSHEVYGAPVTEAALHALCPQGIAPEFVRYSLNNLLAAAVAGLEQSSGLAEAWQNPAVRWWQIVARLFPPAAEVAQAYGLQADDHRRWLYYPRWQAALIRRHLPNFLGLVRSDPALLESARQEAIRRDLLEWIAQE